MPGHFCFHCRFSVAVVRGVGLMVLSMGGQQLDTRSPTGKLMLTMLAAVAEFERNLMLERQREGVTREEIASRLGIGVASVYRVLAAKNAA
jgi:DNA invertase Pin-like site-specific DNA recombinase